MIPFERGKATMRSFVAFFTKFANRLTQFSGILILLLSLLVCAHVILRGIFNSGIDGIYEIVQYTMLTVVSLSLAENELTGGSIIVNYLLDKMKPRTANIVMIIMYGISLAFMGYVLYNQVLLTTGKLDNGAVTGVLQIPHWLIGFVTCLGLFFLLLAFVVKIYNMVSGHKDIIGRKLTADEIALAAANSTNVEF
jgi:TRAP-type C4-dicarboxylate transport system permease small subunit